VPHYRLSRDLLALLNEMGLHAKYINRKGGHVVYFKESEQIEDCLTRMGAANASLELMGVKMVKNIRNNANRVTNCENANIDKTVAASAAQVDAVKRILAAGSLDALPPDLRTLAALRLENPELSLRELGEELAQRGEKLTRSGINHRLRRIMAFADKL
jgi:DNA-binding protein WhiA